MSPATVSRLTGGLPHQACLTRQNTWRPILLHPDVSGGKRQPVP